MAKQVRVNLTIDKEVVEKAKGMGLNLSKTFEICLKQRIEALSALERKTMTNGGNVDTRSVSLPQEWRARGDLNPGSPAPEACALPSQGGSTP